MGEQAVIKGSVPSRNYSANITTDVYKDLQIIPVEVRKVFRLLQPLAFLTGPSRPEREGDQREKDSEPR